MNIVITGATGFIGLRLTERLLNDGYQVIAIVREQSDISELPKEVTTYVYRGNVSEIIDLFRDEKISGIIHLAAYCPTIHQSSDVANLIKSNVLFGAEVIEAAAQAGVGWFINTGSYMQHFNDKDYSPSILYAATKQAFLDLTRYWSDAGKINVVTLELFDNFGLGDTRKKIFTLWKRAFQTQESIDMSPGQQIIDVSPIENVIEAFATLCCLMQDDKERKYNGAVFSLQSDNRMTLKELANLFQKVSNKTLNINWGNLPYREREIMEPWTKGVPVPGYKPVISLEQAICNYLEIE